MPRQRRQEQVIRYADSERVDARTNTMQSAASVSTAELARLADWKIGLCELRRVGIANVVMTTWPTREWANNLSTSAFISFSRVPPNLPTDLAVGDTEL